jgi:hypothetical protein
VKVIFRSKDFASVEGSGFGFNNRRPMTSSWHYQGRVQHRQWQGTYECYWNGTDDPTKRAPTELIWTVRGDARLFGLVAALKAKGFTVNIEQD